MFKRTINKLLSYMGYRIERIRSIAPGSDGRPLLDIRSILEDARARGLIPGFILDVGANRGTWTTMARRIFPDASFLLIEPQDEMAPELNRLCAETPRTSWIHAGAGATAGQLHQTIWDDLQGSSFLPSEDSELKSQGKQRITEVNTIDFWLDSRGLPVPDLVKLDIQGFELEALKGATRLFGDTELFVLEASLYSFMPNMPIIREVVDFMGERGYELYDVAGYMRRPIDGALGQLDLVFAKRNGLLRASDNW